MKDRRPVTVAFNQNRRVQRRRQVIHVLPDEVALRVVCHASVIGGIIGANGSVISKLRRDTGTKIHCEAPVNDSDHGIIFIIGSTTINKNILLTDRVGDFLGGEQEDWVTCNVSAAQAALISVLERSWMVLEDKEAYCGILANRTQIGAVMGKRGKNVESMRRESGAMIRVLPQPTWSTNNDELIQITGSILPVKKALVMVSGVLQNCPPLNGYPLPLCSKAYDSSTNGNSEDPHSEFFPNLRSLPPLSSENASEAASSRHLSSVDAEGNNYHDSRDTERNVVFKLICTNVAAGGIIGKNGTVIRALQNETGAAISFKAPLKHGERIVTISAFENLESRYSAAQNALLLVFARTVEIDIEKRRLHDGTTVKALLLVPSQFANGFFTNNDEEIIGICAEVHVSVGDQIMDCISNKESIIEIKGEYKQVEKALSQIAFKLRDTLLPKELLDEIRARVSNPYSVAGASHISNPQPLQNATRGDSLSISDSELDLNMVKTGTDLMKSIDYLMHTGVFNDAEELNGGTASLPNLQDNDSTKGTKQLQLTSSLDILSFPLRSKGISLKNQTLELVIEKDALVTLYGRNGAGLDNLQQISGAKVYVKNPTGSETMVVISGTCEQTRAAMSLIMSILADQ